MRAILLSGALLFMVHYVSTTPPIVFRSYWTKSIDKINSLRKLHSVKNITVREDLNQAAQHWADQMVEYNLWSHSPTPYGENIAKGWSSSIDLFESTDKNEFVNNAIDLWYDEVHIYDFSKQGWSQSTGHFTQLVWKDTTNIGIGIAYSKKTKAVFVVMNFWPSGNWNNGFYANVFPPNVFPPSSYAPPSPLKVLAVNKNTMKKPKKSPPPRKIL